MAKIKVAFFADMLERGIDGAVRTMYQLIDRIPDDKFDFLFFTGTSIKLNSVKIPSYVIPFNKTYKMAFPNIKSLTLTRSLRDFNPDVIHIATPSSLGYFALNYAQNNDIPVLSIYHTHYISYLKYYLKPLPFFIPTAEFIVAGKYKDFYNKCDVVYTPTVQIINELKNIGISNRYLKLWQRGLDTKLFNPLKKDEGFVKNLTGNDYPCVLFASRLVWEKNLETLFGIYDEIENKNLKINFVIAGTGTAEEIARRRMKKAFFLGHINHEALAKLYASCKALVFPSVSETYGNVVVEAMASGCIPIIARGGGSQSLVSDNESGFLCEPNNASEYVEKIMMTLKYPELGEKMRLRGINYASGLCWEKLAGEYFNDLTYLSQFAQNKSNVISLRDSVQKNSFLRRLKVSLG